MLFTDRISRYISRHDLLCRGGFYIVALSGGTDSVALLLTLRELGYRLDAAHCNFTLRGDESVRDENFCVELCQKLGITLHRIHFDTRTYASLHHQSVEMAARELRYRYFEQLRRDIKADGVCVAHHSDDQVETVLLNLVRGTGIQGLQGMRPRQGNILRPLLGVSRQDILTFLAEKQQPFVTDSTNLEDEAMRNKLRLNVIPLLRQINPASSSNIIRMTENLHEASVVLEQALQEGIRAITMEDGAISIPALLQQPSPTYLLWQLLSPKGFKRAQVEEMASCSRSGATWLSDHWVASISQDRFYLVERSTWEQVLPTMKLPEDGTYIYNSSADRNNDMAPWRIRVYRRYIDEDYQIDPSPNVAQLDATKVAFPLVLRPIATGDKFCPFGMDRAKLVSAYLADHKVPLHERRRQLVLCSATGEIVWLVGQRIDNRFAIQRKQGELLVISYQEEG